MKKKIHIKKEDLVMVIAGNDKGLTGRVLEVYSEKDRVLVEGINIRKRHTRPSQKYSGRYFKQGNADSSIKYNVG